MTTEGLLQGKRILVLEDDFYLATDEKALLERAGARVVGPFGIACKERDILSAGEIDGAVVDINLGKGPSFDLSRVLGEQGIPFVFVPGYDEAAIPDELSPVPRLEKPVRERELISTLAKIIAEPLSEDR